MEVIMQIDVGLDSARRALKIGLGLAAFLAGADKFFGLLTDWTRYLSPAVRAIVPLAPATFMSVVGVVEMCVGIAILGRWTRVGAYLAMVWLLAIAANLVVGGAFLDVAVRDVEMAIAAYALARLTEARAAAVTARVATAPDPARRIGTAA
jgi:hypothetical protein